MSNILEIHVYMELKNTIFPTFMILTLKLKYEQISRDK